MQASRLFSDGAGPGCFSYCGDRSRSARLGCASTRCFNTNGVKTAGIGCRQNRTMTTKWVHHGVAIGVRDQEINNGSARIGSHRATPAHLTRARQDIWRGLHRQESSRATKAQQVSVGRPSNARGSRWNSTHNLPPQQMALRAPSTLGNESAFVHPASLMLDVGLIEDGHRLRRD